MNSNNDNKEKLTDGNEAEFTENGEIAASRENIENAAEEENLLEITSGEIEYPQERVSLVDAIKYAFDTNEETSEERVVEDAGEEVVFVVPEKIMDYVEDYLSHVEEGSRFDESEAFEGGKVTPDSEVYFSTAESDTLPPVDENNGTGEKSANADEPAYAEEPAVENEEENAPEAVIQSVEETAEDEENTADTEQAEAYDDSEPDEDTGVQAEEKPTGTAEISDESESDAPAEKEGEISGDSEDMDSSEDIEDTAADEAAENADEESELNIEETSEVDLFEIADVQADDGLAEDDDDEEEIPEIFTMGSAVAELVPENTADDDGGQSETGEDSADESEDAGNVSAAITVHRHRSNAAELSDESESGGDDTDDEYEEMFGVEDESDNNDENQSFFQRHSISAWAKKKTAGGWTKFALKCVGVLLLTACFMVVLYVNGKLDLINYRDADDFEQYYNLSDTDYVSSSDEVYENPVHYNSSTTLEGFDESMIDIDKDDVINVLLIGTDVRGGTYEDRGNTDSMILLSINTRDKNIKLTSFMRDMYVTIPGRGKNRINAAYAYGGPQLLFDTLKENFDVDVDLYARVNFANFRKIIDRVGGIEMELTQAEANYMNKYSQRYNTDRVEAGLQTLDGAQALSYARCRKVDSDFGRTERQRKVLIAFVDKIKGCSLTELDSLLNTLLPMIQTNMPKVQIVGLMVDALNYLNNDVETLNIPIKNSWRSVTIRQMSVICPNFELNKTAIVAHIYSTYKLDVENTMYQSFEVPKGDTATRKKTTTTAATTIPSVAEEDTTTTEAAEPTESTSSSTAASKTYWWDRTTASRTTTTTQSGQNTTTTASTTTAAPKTSKTQSTSSTMQNSVTDDEAA